MKRQFKPFATSVMAAFGLLLIVTAGFVPGLPPSQTAAAASSKQDTFTYGLEHPTFRQSGQLYVPVKEVAPLLDLQVGYDSNSKAVLVTGLQQFAKLNAGKSKAIGKNNVAVSLGAPVRVIKGDTYVPAALFAKMFGVPITVPNAKEPQVITAAYASKYLTMRTGDMLFWMNRTQGTLYAGLNGQLPAKAGKVTLQSPDWLGGKARQVDDSTYVLDINNAHGEPHIFNDWCRILIHDSKVVQQAVMSFGGPSFVTLMENAASSEGLIVLNDGHQAKLVTPEGKLAETLNLDQLGGAEDVYSLEALEKDFLLIRPYSTGRLLLIDRQSGERTALYLSLLDQETIERLESDDMGLDDGLAYTGRSGSVLHFSWHPPFSSETETKSFDMSK